VQLAWSPRAFVLKGFLSDDECEHIKTIVSWYTHANTRLYLDCSQLLLRSRL
jgi:hypothetical protein